jgi:hypothetical protein
MHMSKIYLMQKVQFLCHYIHTGTNVTPTSQVSMAVSLVLLPLMAGNLSTKVQGLGMASSGVNNIKQYEKLSKRVPTLEKTSLMVLLITISELCLPLRYASK